MNRLVSRSVILAFLALLGSSLIGLPSFLMINPSQAQQETPVRHNHRNIEQIAKTITIRLSLDSYQDKEDHKASGTIVDVKELQNSQGYLYLVLTADHVLKDLKEKVTGNPQYRVETHDGETHIARLYPKEINWRGNDLGLLWFVSAKLYQPANISSVVNIANENEIVFAAGFPCNNWCDQQFKFTQGQPFIELVQQGKHLDGGYQIGLTNDTESGMSGGPILSSDGHLIGIHGRGKHQTVFFQGVDMKVNSYAFMDGTEPPQSEQEKFQDYAWGVPIDTYKRYKKEQFPEPFKEIEISSEEASSLVVQGEVNVQPNQESHDNSSASHESRAKDQGQTILLNSVLQNNPSLIGAIVTIILMIAFIQILSLIVLFKIYQISKKIDDIKENHKEISSFKQEVNQDIEDVLLKTEVIEKKIDRIISDIKSIKFNISKVDTIELGMNDIVSQVKNIRYANSQNKISIQKIVDVLRQKKSS